MRRVLLGLALALAKGAAALAHAPSTAFLAVEGTGVALDLALRDLEAVIGLDADGDGAIRWGELEDRRGEVEALAARDLAFLSGGAACALAPLDLLFERRDGIGYAALRLEVRCPGGRAPDALAYGLFFDIDPTHRAILRWPGGVVALGPESRRAELGAPHSAEGFLSFFRTGMRHIAYGLDHVLFLLIVILPAAVAAPGARRGAAGEILRIVTAFTLSHALSVTLAVLGIVTLPSRPVEIAIAATIVLTAIDNFRPFLPGRRWAVAFVFGLVHGLGFAGALGPLDLAGRELAVALLGFNLGVEAGQIALAALLLALAWPAVAATPRARALLPAGSIFASCIGLVWLVERALGAVG